MPRKYFTLKKKFFGRSNIFWCNCVPEIALLLNNLYDTNTDKRFNMNLLYMQGLIIGLAFLYNNAYIMNTHDFTM